MEKKMIGSVTNELGKHPSQEGLNRVVGKSTTKRIILLWTYGKHLKIWGAILSLRETIDLIESTKEMKHFFHQDDKEITWFIYKHHNSNIP